jgi:hypothetical protein
MMLSHRLQELFSALVFADWDRLLFPPEFLAGLYLHWIELEAMSLDSSRPLNFDLGWNHYFRFFHQQFLLPSE